MQKMNTTFESVQMLFLQTLRDVQDMRKRGFPLRRMLKEQELGRCCYLAEEFLSLAQLRALKNEAKLDDQQWRAYKMRLCKS
jgi:hypothetical protein